MAEYNTAQLVDLLRSALARTDAPIGEHWGVFVTTDICKAAAGRLEELQARLDAYEVTGLTPEQITTLASDKIEQVVNMLVDTVPQLVQAIAAQLPQLVEAAINDTVEELQEG